MEGMIMNKDFKNRSLAIAIILFANTILSWEGLSLNLDEEMFHNRAITPVMPTTSLENYRKSTKAAFPSKKLIENNLIFTEKDEIDRSMEGVADAVARALGKVLTKNHVDKEAIRVMKFSVKHASQNDERILRIILKRDLECIATKDGKGLTSSAKEKIIEEMSKPLRKALGIPESKLLKFKRVGQIGRNDARTTKFAVGTGVGIGVGGIVGTIVYDTINNKNENSQPIRNNKSTNFNSLTLDELETMQEDLKEKAKIYNLIVEKLEK